MDILTWLRQEARLKKMALVIVFIAMFLDYMLLSVVVPVLPSILYRAGQATSISGNSTASTVSPPIIQSVSNRSGILGSTFAPPPPFPGLFSNHTVAKRSLYSNCTKADAQLDDINIQIGLLLAAKSVVQLVINPFIGPLTERVGCHIPLSAGFCIIILAAILFAFSSSFILLLLARSVQGVGGSFLAVAGMAMLADVYKDPTERGRAMGIAFSGMALGLIVGAPFGSVTYQFLGKIAPFMTLIAISVVGGGLHFLIFQSLQVQKEMEEGTPLLTLLRDPYILVAAGGMCIITLIIATIETALPIWMIKTLCASDWQLGIVFLPDSISYIFASNICGHLSQKHSRSWLFACMGLTLGGVATIALGFSKAIYHVIVLNAFVGFSVGTVDASIMPLMGYLVDLRYMPVYGSVYAIADVAICIGFSIGPAIAGPLVTSIGFTWLMAIIGAVNIMFAPLCIFLSNPPRRRDI